MRVNAECPNCKALAMVVLYSHRLTTGRRQTLQCKACDYRVSRYVGDSEVPPADRRPNSNRRFSDETILEIRAKGTGAPACWAELGREYGCSREMMRQICQGLIYRDLLPAGFVPASNRRKCWHCTEWQGRHHEIHPCAVGMPDVLTEGESFAADCEFYVRRRS